MWEPVEATGGVYWWNIDTDETTAIGEPCPALAAAAAWSAPAAAGLSRATGQPQQQGGGMMSGLGQTMARWAWRSAPGRVSRRSGHGGPRSAGGPLPMSTVDRNSGGGRRLGRTGVGDGRMIGPKTTNDPPVSSTWPVRPTPTFGRRPRRYVVVRAEPAPSKPTLIDRGAVGSAIRAVDEAVCSRSRRRCLAPARLPP